MVPDAVTQAAVQSHRLVEQTQQQFAPLVQPLCILNRLW